MPRGRHSYRDGHFVYLIGAEAMQENKIGRCNSHPERRRIDMNVGSPKELVLVTWCEVESLDQAKRLEQHLHEYFSGRRVRGEWFNYIHYDEFHYAARRWISGRILGRGSNGRKKNIMARTFTRYFGDARIYDLLAWRNTRWRRSRLPACCACASTREDDSPPEAA